MGRSVIQPVLLNLIYAYNLRLNCRADKRLTRQPVAPSVLKVPRPSRSIKQGCEAHIWVSIEI